MSISNQPFLTLQDERARIKGSRDPLGFQSIWVGFGREIINNFTTISDSLRQFTTLILGFYFVEKAIDENKLDFEEFINGFLRFEQLVDYSRYKWMDKHNIPSGDIRGITIVKNRYELFDGKVPIGIGSNEQILSNQRSYGIWGFYTVPARESGLIKQNETKLTREAKDFVEKNYIPVIEKAGKNISSLIIDFINGNKFNFDTKNKHSTLADVLAKIHRPTLNENERKFYQQYLLFCKKNNIQEQFYNLLIEARNKNIEKNDLDMIRALIELSSKNHPNLKDKLYKILIIEEHMAPISNLFNFLLNQNNRNVQEVVKDIHLKWEDAFLHIKTDELELCKLTIENVSVKETYKRISNISNMLKQNKFLGVINLLIAQNTEVMKNRGGDAWLSINNDKFNIRYKEYVQGLIDKDKISKYQNYYYFIPSLEKIGKQMNGDFNEQ